MRRTAMIRHVTRRPFRFGSGAVVLLAAAWVGCDGATAPASPAPDPVPPGLASSTGGVHTQPWESPPTRVVSGSTRLLSSDDGITLLVASAPASVELPSAVGRDDLRFTIKNTSFTSGVSVVPAGNEEIDHASRFTLEDPQSGTSVIQVMSFGGNWWIVAKG